MEAVPFSNNSVYEGLGKVNGLIRLEDDVLVLEYQTKDGVFGVLKSRVRETRLGLKDVASIEFDRGRVTSNLRLRVLSIALLSDLPCCESGEARLKIARRDRDAAGGLVSRVQLRLSELRLEAADRKLREMQSDPER